MRHHDDDDPRFNENTKDPEWLRLLGEDNLGWIVVSGDSKILKKSLERQALSIANVTFFVMEGKSWLNTKLPDYVWKSRKGNHVSLQRRLDSWLCRSHVGRSWWRMHGFYRTEPLDRESILIHADAQFGGFGPWECVTECQSHLRAEVGANICWIDGNAPRSRSWRRPQAAALEAGLHRCLDRGLDRCLQARQAPDLGRLRVDRRLSWLVPQHSESDRLRVKAMARHAKRASEQEFPRADAASPRIELGGMNSLPPLDALSF